MFSIIREDFFGTGKIKLLDQATGAYASILPAWGANLNELIFAHANSLHPVIAGDTSIESLHGGPVNFYRGAKLSPFPNRIAEGQYTFQNQLYTLDKNDGKHALHGLLWNLPFRIVREETAADVALIELVYDYISNYIGYPFNYSISIVYRFEYFQLTCSTTIQNNGNDLLPIGDGWHPYFTFNKNIDLLKVKLPACKQLEMENSIPTCRYVESDFFHDEVSLNGLELDHCFELATKEDIAETELIDIENALKIIVWQQCGNDGYQFLQLYTPPNRKSVAIEPMSCAPDAFNNKKGLIVLEPDTQICFSFGIQLKDLL